MAQIRTVEELASLPGGTVIRTATGTLVTRENDWPWWTSPSGTRYSHAALVTYYGPIELVGAPGQSDLYLEAVVSVKAALALHAEHVRGLRGETECVCLGCQMARLLRGEEPR